MPIDIPRTARLASPSFDGTSRFLVFVGAAVGLAAWVVLPAGGWVAAVSAVALGWFGARRRRTLGAYEGVHGLVIRNWFATREVPWSEVERVEQRRDPWIPVLAVAVLRHGADGSLPISGLRHRRGSTPAPVLTVTRLVRDRREARAREPWNR